MLMPIGCADAPTTNLLMPTRKDFPSMMRSLSAVLAGSLVLASGPARAADGPAGTWKMSIPQSNLTILFILEEKGGKWVGQFLGTNVPDFPKVTLTEIAAAPDSLRLTFKLPREELGFEGRLPPDVKTGHISGSLQLGGRTLLVHLEPSKLKMFDKFDFARETVDQSTDSQVLADAVVDLLKLAGEKMVKIEEARGWADKAFRTADAYGARWQRL